MFLPVHLCLHLPSHGSSSVLQVHTTCLGLQSGLPDPSQTSCVALSCEKLPWVIMTCVLLVLAHLPRTPVFLCEMVVREYPFNLAGT